MRARTLERVALDTVTACAVALAVALRFTIRQPRWLDEAQSVAIARRGLSSLPSSLRHDGAPPAYYALLDVWMRLFGDSPLATRTLSAVLAVATLPVLWAVGRRLGGRSTASAAVVVYACSPFAMRYASETRMYTMVCLLVATGALLLLRTVEHRRRRDEVALAGVTAVLLLTHYWAWYLLACTVVALGIAGRHEPDVRAARRAVLVGALATAWWIPTLVDQVLHTGAPWADRPDLATLAHSLRSYAGNGATTGPLLWTLLVAAFVLGGFGRPTEKRTIELSWRTGPSTDLAVLAIATLGVALVAGIATSSPVPARYTAVAFPLLVLPVAAGVGMQPPAARRRYLAAIAILGLAAGRGVLVSPRTQAGDVAGALRRHAGPADLVVYCPDQLAPSVSSLVPSTLEQITYPPSSSIATVDWVDYAARVAAADPSTFASLVDERAGGGEVFLVVSDHYRLVGGPCRTLQLALEQLRPETSYLVQPRAGDLESAALERLRR